MKAPEILAPAGSMESFAAALASGADVVYLGLSEGFNARARSGAFDLAGLPAVVARAHRAGVKVYLTLNTLIFESELSKVEALLRGVIEAGVDALIVQDPAVAFLAHRLCPELRLHASTQMTISSAEGARFAATLGISRVVLPRELSVDEVARFTRESPMEAEVFVHGALCMAWSGQCLTSEALSNRSANRGQCSQACRMPYDLIVDGERRDLGDVRYLLSPQDLAAHDAVPGLMAAGVGALKIEGRYKNAAYVTTAVDSLRHWRDANLSGPSDADIAQKKRDVRGTQLTFSRGASPGFMHGDNHQKLVIGKTPKHRGILLGRVVELRGPRVRVALDASMDDRDDRDDRDDHKLVRAGMGVMFDVGDPEAFDAPGGPIFFVAWNDNGSDGYNTNLAWQLELTFGDPGPDLSRVKVGQELWLTGDPELQRDAERRAAVEPTGRIAVKLQVTGGVGSALEGTAVAMFAGRTLRATGRSSSTLEAARSGGGISEALLRDKLGAFGGTPFRLEALALDGLAAGLHVPVSELKALRRSLVLELGQQLLTPSLTIATSREQVMELRAELGRDLSPNLDPPQLVPLCRTAEQLEAVIACGVGSDSVNNEVELDFMELVGLGHAVTRAKQAGLRVTLATVRVQKPGEEGYDRRIAALRPDAVLVRHWGGLMHFATADRDATSPRVHGDFSLNVTNSLTARHLLSLGLHTVTASHDLDQRQLLELLPQVPEGRVAITLHHHIATFHNSHCVYAHLLSDGADYRSCGRPCEQHRIALRDYSGKEHPVLVDIGCRNTVFNASAQSAAPLVPTLLKAGVRRFRVELVWEKAEEVQRTLSAYRDLLAGKTTPAAAMRSIGVHEQYGVTTLRR